MRGQGPSAAMKAALQRFTDSGVVPEMRAGTTGRARREFDRFARATIEDWARMARELHRRWQIPAAVEVEDVLAELLAAAWRAIADWDPSRPGSRPLADYVTWNAYAVAKKWLNKQRDAYRRDGKSASRHPIAESRLSPQLTDRRRSVLTGESKNAWDEVPLTPEERVDALRLGETIARTLAPDESEAVFLLVEETGIPDEESPETRVARRLSGEVRLRNGLGSERKARAFVGVAVRNAVDIARRITAAA